MESNNMQLQNESTTKLQSFWKGFKKVIDFIVKIGFLFSIHVDYLKN